MGIKRSKNAQWWKDQEQLGFVFERAFHPFENVHRNTKQRDAVGVLRQLDVGIIEKGKRSVRAFVEIQKRAVKVGIEDFGNWIYKMQTLKAKELIALSEAGFTQPVFKHVKELHPRSVRLARIYQVEDGRIENPLTEFMGVLGAVENKWGFAAVFYQTDKNEVSSMSISPEDKVFDHPSGPSLSLMDFIRHFKVDWENSQFHALTCDLEEGFSWRGNVLRRLMLCVEYRRKISKAKNIFYAYEEEYPVKHRRGICVVSDFMIGDNRAIMEIVAVPTQDDVLLSGQVSFDTDSSTTQTTS
ncbi:MAG: hypothetical protein SFX18_09430 [Pirellulales bacterium]|nr:hypothetical protein [Pirellulales bacterium]